MNADTKRHIDSARQVLVGVVPNPSTQIDQITNALIYKFMDDMDQSVIKIGGKPTFFTGDLEKYAWVRIMDSRIGSQERMNLYSEALIKFSQAKQLPELFRDIFKLAFLPYRSPEVLDMFLKEINYFSYSHSEDLGDAFEYLLSIMSSQGDAGQFRTPRHIIEFIVDVVNPTKDDKILDPACGTAGFLISAYKHILEQHDGKDDPKKTEKPLTPEQKKKLTSNFIGYDISPDMVRLSKVNMYLHNFKDPQIIAYNTLADEEHWNDKFDVILANPPFMTPKGAGKPHSKFTIQASKSEVLFVDYIMNHLRPKGRAGIIVPEGIIFQSGTAYKQLRKNLVEDGLFAVVSLPSGVFNPYAGVKTSILLFDNEIAKQKTEMLFVKVENDGFDLGATKRPISKNDLPTALDILNKWKTSSVIPAQAGIQCVAVSKEKIAESGDYNLSGDGYRVATDYTNAKWPMVELGEVCIFEYGKPLKEENRKDGEYPVFGSNGIVGYHNEFLVKGPFIIIGRKGTAGAVVYSEKNGFPIDTAFYIKLLNKETIDLKFLFHILESLELGKTNTQAGVPGLNRNDAYKLKIPLPPLEIQEQIVAELDGYAGIIAGAKQIAESWKPVIDVDPSWEQVKFDDYIFFQEGPGIRNWQFTDHGIKLLNVKNISNGEIDLSNSNKYISTEEFEKKYKHFLVEDGDIILASSGATYGKNAYFRDPGYPVMVNTSNIRLHPKDKNKIMQGYIKLILDSELFKLQIDRLVTGAAQPNFGPYHLKQVIIPLPPLAIQKQIVEKIEAERALVESAKKLIEIYDQKTKEAIAKLWAE